MRVFSPGGSTVGIPAPEIDWTRSRVLLVAAMTTLSLLAIASAQAVDEGSKAAVVLPLAIGAGLLLALLAVSRFQIFVLLALGIRSSLDLAKLSRTDSASRALDPASILAVLFLMAGLLWLAAQYRARGELAGSRLRSSFLFFLTACFLSTMGSGDPASSLLESLRIASVIMMFVVVEQVCRDVRRMRQVLAAIFVSAVLPLLLTAFGYMSGTQRWEEKGGFTRILGSFNQSNEFGRYLMLLIIMGVAIYPVVHGRTRRALAVVIIGTAACLIPTYTRTALLGTAIGLLVVAFVYNRKAVLGVLAVAALAWLLVPSLSDRFSDGNNAVGDGPEGTHSSLSWRLDYWGEVLPLARQNPLTGVGLGETEHLTANQQPPHNDFVRAYVEIGILGLLAYLLLLWRLVSTGRRAVRAAPTGTFDRGVATGFLGSAVAFVAVSTVANVFSNVVTLWYFSAFAAAAAAVLRRRTAGGTRALEASWR
ncbi:MAG: O-antigen ligase family protein [Gaiellales bacterium]